jgi:hypothetical protein
MNKPYFHELNEDQRHAVCTVGMTAQHAVDTYAQPDWCSYPNALAGYLGCFSLLTGGVKSEASCTGCDCYRGTAEVEEDGDR